MRANVSTLHELEEWEGVRDGAKVMEIEGEAHPPKEEENEGRGGKAETPQNGKRKMGNERARREGGEGGCGTDKRTRGAVGGVRRGGREGLCAGLQTGKPALWRQTDGDPVLKNRRKSPRRKLDQLHQAQQRNGLSSPDLQQL